MYPTYHISKEDRRSCLSLCSKLNDEKNEASWMYATYFRSIRTADTGFLSFGSSWMCATYFRSMRTADTGFLSFGSSWMYATHFRSMRTADTGFLSFGSSWMYATYFRSMRTADTGFLSFGSSWMTRLNIITNFKRYISTSNFEFYVLHLR
jgi:hypothetical protein